MYLILLFCSRISFSCNFWATKVSCSFSILSPLNQAMYKSSTYLIYYLILELKQNNILFSVNLRRISGNNSLVGIPIYLCMSTCFNNILAKILLRFLENSVLLCVLLLNLLCLIYGSCIRLQTQNLLLYKTDKLGLIKIYK